MSDSTDSLAPVPTADGAPFAASPAQPGAACPPSPGRAAHSRAFEIALAAPFEITFHDVRAGIRIEYLTGEQVISRLLEVLGPCGWSFRILEHGINSEADEVWVLGELQLLLDPDDRVVRQQFGSAKIKRSRSIGAPLEIGYDLKAAATDCLKKCATLIGVGLYLTRKDETKAAPVANNNTSSRGAQERPIGRSSRRQDLSPSTHPGHSAPTNVQSATPTTSTEPLASVCDRCGKPIQAAAGKGGRQWTPAQLAAYTRQEYHQALCASCLRAISPAVAPS
jgi:hypothetical protein